MDSCEDPAEDVAYSLFSAAESVGMGDSAIWVIMDADWSSRVAWYVALETTTVSAIVVSASAVSTAILLASVSIRSSVALFTASGLCRHPWRVFVVHVVETVGHVVA